MKERSLLSSVLGARCPRCRKGEVFKYSVFNVPRMFAVHENCPHCNLRYEKEPGNFYGAMYVSYAFSVAIFLAVGFVLYYFFGDPSIEVYIASILVVAALLFPLNFRYSRIIFLYLIWKS